MKAARKYLSLYWAFFRASLTADMEFRANFAMRIITDIFWYIAQIASFEVYFRYTNKIGDWDIAQTRVFLGVLFLMDGIFMVLFHENLEQIQEKVRKGQLDLLLAKPVNSQFMISLQKANTAVIGNVLLGAVWFFWSLSKLPDFSWLRLCWLLILIPCGLAVFYCMRFIFAAVSVIFTRTENLQYLWYQVYRLGMRPDSIYSPWLKYILLSVVPIGVFASVPSRFLLEAPNYGLLLWTIFLSSLCLYASARFWRYTLAFYSSASS